MTDIFTLGNLATFGGYVIAGALAIYGIAFGQYRTRRGDNDQITQNLINNYKLTVENQEKKIKELSEKEIQQGKDLAHLQGQIKVLQDIVTLRDPETLKVFKEAPAVFAIARATNEISKENGQKIDVLTDSLASFMDALRLALPHVVPAPQLGLDH